MSNPTPLRDLIVLKNVAVTKMPLATVAKNHGLTAAQICNKARYLAEFVAFVAAGSHSQAMKRYRLTVKELDAILDYYHASHPALEGGD